MALFLDKGLLHPDFARKLLSWRHSGFSVESGTRIHDKEIFPRTFLTRDLRQIEMRNRDE